MKTLLLAVFLLFSVVGCAVSTHPVTAADLGRAVSSDAMLQTVADGPRIRTTRIDSARWQVDLGGLIHLEHARSVEAGLEDELESIVISFFVLEHPTRGTFLIDTGVAASFGSPDTAPITGLVASEMNLELLDIKTSLASWLDGHGPVSGVFLTHLHLDHVMGLPDLPNDVPIYSGPGETSANAFIHMFIQGTTDDLLEGKSPIREWSFHADAGNRFEGVIDVFGDGSLFALHVPGHTPGSTAYFVRSTTGDRLIVGDASHTDWGWTNCVEPGTFNHDREGSAVSLHRLKAFANEIPDLTIELGHQHHKPRATSVACDGPLLAHSE